MKRTFKDHAAAEQEDRWRWSIESGLWEVLDKMLRHEEVPMPHDARIRLADLLKTLPLPKGREGRPRGRITKQKRMWTEFINPLMQLELDAGKSVPHAATAVAEQLPDLKAKHPDLYWRITEKEIEDGWRHFRHRSRRQHPR